MATLADRSVCANRLDGKFSEVDEARGEKLASLRARAGSGAMNHNFVEGEKRPNALRLESDRLLN